MKVVYYVTVDCGFGWGVQNIKVNRLQFLYDLCCQNKQYWRCRQVKTLKCWTGTLCIWAVYLDPWHIVPPPPSRDIVVCMNKVWFLLSCGRWFRLTLLITSSDHRDCILTTAYALIEHSRFKRITLLLWKWHFDYRYVGILTNITCAYYHFHGSSIPDFEYIHSIFMEFMGTSNPRYYHKFSMLHISCSKNW